MMRLSIYTGLFLVLVSVSNFAQTVEPSAVVERKVLQLELESLYVMEKDGLDRYDSWSIPSLLMRYGLDKNVELQLNVPYLRESRFEDDDMVSSRTFLDNVQMGLSVNLWESNHILPQAAIMARALIPVYDNENQEVGTLLALNLSNTLTQQLSLNYNIGWVHDTGGNSGYYIANLSYDITPTTHTFVEFFGSTYDKIQMNHNINSGIGFNLGNAFCLDLSVANGLNHDMMFFGGVLTYQLSI